MEAEAVTSRSSVETASQRALLAGADLILMTGDGSFRPVSQSLLARARRDRAFRARVRAAAAQVLALKRSLGLSPPAAR
jgi:beta-glucosidase-like glycosyl hydrolase